MDAPEYESAREVKGGGRGFVGSDLTAYRTWLAAPATLGLSLRTLSTVAEANLTICPAVWPFAFGLDGADCDIRIEHDVDARFHLLRLVYGAFVTFQLSRSLHPRRSIV